ncbi:FAS1 domain-containing protein [Aspergillus pseudoustus]|uniref:FAS1 domain-containing protein n=1 Tax=Aspergillus pseudoustus TaxID=1810923 RepID=A0ABR4KFK1_9EURO
MKVTSLLFTLIPALATALEDPLSYRQVEPVYTLPKPNNVTTLLDFIASRSDLSHLHKSIQQSGGFAEAFDTNPTWKFTFFAPNDEAFNNTGRYFETFEATPKGKWWLGNTIIHHYVPNSLLATSSFNETYQRFQTGTYLFVGAEKQDSDVILNKVARVVEGDIPITNGVVHIIDRILEPSAQIHEADLPWLKQTFIAGSCSNPALPYC